jgi:hypothetical protein
VSLRESQRREEGQGVMFPAGAPRPALGEEAQVILGTFGRLSEELGTHVAIRDTYGVVTS